MSYRFAATGDALSTSTVYVNAYPCTIAVRFRLYDLNPAGVGFLAATRYFANDDAVSILYDTANGRMDFRVKQAGATTTTRLSRVYANDGLWHTAVWSCTSATERQGFFDRTASIIDTNSRAFPACDGHVIGALYNGSAYVTSTGHQVAEHAIWNAALTYAEACDIADGAQFMRVRPVSMRSYLDLRRGGTPIDAQGATWTVNGAPVVADNPRARPRRVPREVSAPTTFNAAWARGANSVIYGAVAA